jgi:hypothetical protein
VFQENRFSQVPKKALEGLAKQQVLTREGTEKDRDYISLP